MDQKRITKIITSWKLEHGGRFRAHERPAAILDLINTLVANGLELDEIKQSTKDEIVEVCTNESSKKIAKWKKIVSEEIEDAIVAMNPEEIIRVKPEDRKIKVIESTEPPPTPQKPIQEEEVKLYPQMDMSKIPPLPEGAKVDMDDLLQELGLNDE